MRTLLRACLTPKFFTVILSLTSCPCAISTGGILLLGSHSNLCRRYMNILTRRRCRKNQLQCQNQNHLCRYHMSSAILHPRLNCILLRGCQNLCRYQNILPHRRCRRNQMQCHSHDHPFHHRIFFSIQYLH